MKTENKDDLYAKEIEIFKKTMELHAEEIKAKIKLNNFQIALNQKQNKLFDEELKIIKKRLEQ